MNRTQSAKGSATWSGVRPDVPGPAKIEIVDVVKRYHATRSVEALANVNLTIAAGEFDTLIATLQKTLGLTVFMVTHDLASLNTVCDRVAALADGKIVAIGPMHELLQSEHPWVRAYFHGKRSQMLQPQAR